MTDTMTDAQRHYTMSQVHSASTKPELKLRHALWRQGFRYRMNDRHLPGSPDIVLPRYRSVIFVHGCFWHGHKGCKNYTVPKTNTDFWVAKVARNQERDQEVWRQLEAKGWSVIIVWECELKKSVLDETINRIAEEIRQNGEAFRQTMEDRRKSRETYRQERNTSKERTRSFMAEAKTL